MLTKKQTKAIIDFSSYTATKADKIGKYSNSGGVGAGTGKEGNTLFVMPGNAGVAWIENYDDFADSLMTMNSNCLTMCMNVKAEYYAGRDWFSRYDNVKHDYMLHGSGEDIRDDLNAYLKFCREHKYSKYSPYKVGEHFVNAWLLSKALDIAGTDKNTTIYATDCFTRQPVKIFGSTKYGDNDIQINLLPIRVMPGAKEAEPYIEYKAKTEKE